MRICSKVIGHNPKYRTIGIFDTTVVVDNKSKGAPEFCNSTTLHGNQYIHFRVPHLPNMNVCAAFCANPPNSCHDISLKARNMNLLVPLKGKGLLVELLVNIGWSMCSVLFLPKLLFPM